MTVTTTIKGDYRVYASTSSDAATVIEQLTEALSEDGVASGKVIFMDSTTKQAVAGLGR